MPFSMPFSKSFVVTVTCTILLSIVCFFFFEFSLRFHHHHHHLLSFFLGHAQYIIFNKTHKIHNLIISRWIHLSIDIKSHLCSRCRETRASWGTSHRNHLHNNNIYTMMKWWIKHFAYTFVRSAQIHKPNGLNCCCFFSVCRARSLALHTYTCVYPLVIDMSVPFVFANMFRALVQQKLCCLCKCVCASAPSKSYFHDEKS